MSYGIGRRCGLDAPLLWLWRRLAAAVLIQPLAQELPYATDAAIKRRQKQKYKISMKWIFFWGGGIIELKVKKISHAATVIIYKGT